MAQDNRTRPRKPSDTFRADACPLCAFLKEFQSECVQSLNHRLARTLCNFHTWLVAKLADAGAAADIFLRMLELSLEADSSRQSCDLCKWVADQEHRKIEEIAQKLDEPDSLHWLCEQEPLCLPHARKLLDRVPNEFRDEIILSVQRLAAELKGELTTLSRNAKARLPIRPGLLGRAAEYLVSKRGLGVKP
jgi:hypothetical protein